MSTIKNLYNCFIISYFPSRGSWEYEASNDICDLKHFYKNEIQYIPRDFDVVVLVMYLLTT